MNIIGILLLCVLSYCLGLQKGKDPNFFKKHWLNKSREKAKEKPKRKSILSPTEKVVSIQQYKEKNKRNSR